MLSNEGFVQWVKIGDYTVGANSTKEITISFPLAANVSRWGYFPTDWSFTCSITRPNTSQMIVKIRNNGNASHTGSVDLIGVGYVE